MSDLGPRLVREGLIAREDLALALQAQAREGRTVTYHLLAIGAIAEDALIRYFCTRFPVEELKSDQIAGIPRDVLGLVPGQMAGEFRVLPIGRAGDTLTLAMADPSDTHALDEVRFYTGCQVVPFVARESVLSRALEQCYGVIDAVVESALRIGGVPPDEPVVELTKRSQSASRWDGGDASGKAEPENVVLLTKKRPRPPTPPPFARADDTIVTPMTILAEHGSERAKPRERHDTIQDLSAAILAASDLAWSAEEESASSGRLEPLAPRVKGPEPPMRERTETAPMPTEAPPVAPAPEPPSAPFPPAKDEPPPRRRTMPVTPQPMKAVKPPEPAAAPPAPPRPELPAKPPPSPLQPILEARDRDEAILRALEALSGHAQRCVFFVVKRGVAEGWEARGGGLTRERVRNLWVPLSSPSVLKDVIAARAPFVGAPPDTISNQMLLAALGGHPDRVLLCPVLVRQMAVGALYADGLPSDAELPFAEAVAGALASAMERIILGQKGKK